MEMILQFIVLMILITLTATTFSRILFVREKVSCNSVMIAAMTLGTMNGLIMGTMLALTQPFVLNSILSMIIGISSGLILGTMFNLMTIIEGILGGLMGGLMGAMLGEMLVPGDIYLISLVLIVILGMVTLLIIKQIKEETQPEYQSVELKSVNLNKLALIVACSCLLLFSGIVWGTHVPSESNGHTEETHNH